LRGDFEEALRIYERADAGEGDPTAKAALDSARAALHFRRGERAACRRAAVRSLDTATSCGYPSALAEAHMAMSVLAALEGDRQAIDLHQLTALAAAERVGDSSLLMRIHMNRSVYLEEEGRYQEGLRELEEAMALADLLSPPDYQAGGLCNRGDACLALGRLEEAVTDYEQAKAIYEQMGSQSVFLALRGLARAYRERGDLALSRVAYEHALLSAERAGELVSTALCLGGLARILVREEPDEALAFAEQALDYAKGLARVGALVDVGWVMLARGDEAQARSLASDAAAVARGQHDRAGLAGALGLRALAEADRSRRVALLEESIAIWRELGNPLEEAKAELALALTSEGREAQANARRVEHHLHRVGIRVQSAAEAAGMLMQIVEGAEPAVAIRSLGGFRLLRNGEIVPTAAWQSKKARDALQILVAARGRPLTRDALIEALWPEEDPEKASNRLSVALSTVRAVLDPAHGFAPDHYVLANRETVALGPGCVDLDVELFLADAEIGLARRRDGASPETTALLEAAEDAYTGDFLEEVYEDWAVPLREEARAAYLAVARALAEDAAEAGAVDTAVRYRLRVLERDPYDESSHLGLITTLRTAGRHGDARRAYGAYVARMEELGIEPVPL